jgi:4a-hydroxytetrahydrobiopterin dehydratase
MTDSGWIESRDGLVKRFTWDSFPQAISFVNEVAGLAEAANHHPEIEIVWRKVKLLLVTHEAGDRVTELDRKLAAEIDKISLAKVMGKATSLFT